jgi:hypothetical protein
MSDSSSPDPDRKRSMLLSPVGIGTMALLGTGVFAATNGFGLGNRPCMTTQVATSVLQCQAIMPGPACAAAFAGGAGAVGLSRTGNSGAWSHQPLRVGSGGNYLTMSGSPFAINASCSSSSSRSSSSSYFYSGGSSGSSTGAAGQTSVQRGGFGSTASGFHGGGG